MESAQVAVVAWVMTRVLMQPGMVMYPYWSLLDRLASHGWAWLAKPLGYCDRCFAGQFALWYWVVTRYPVRLSDAFSGIFFVCLTILFIQLLNRYADAD